MTSVVAPAEFETPLSQDARLVVSTSNTNSDSTLSDWFIQIIVDAEGVKLLSILAKKAKSREKFHKININIIFLTDSIEETG